MWCVMYSFWNAWIPVFCCRRLKFSSTSCSMKIILVIVGSGSCLSPFPRCFRGVEYSLRESRGLKGQCKIQYLDVVLGTIETSEERTSRRSSKMAVSEQNLCYLHLFSGRHTKAEERCRSDLVGILWVYGIDQERVTNLFALNGPGEVCLVVWKPLAAKEVSWSLAHNWADAGYQLLLLSRLQACLARVQILRTFLHTFLGFLLPRVSKSCCLLSAVGSKRNAPR